MKHILSAFTFVVAALAASVPSNTDDAPKPKETITADGPQPLGVSGFAITCDSWDTTVGSGFVILSGTCPNGAGGNIDSSINLNSCIGNFNGHLACASGGNFAASCSDISSISTGNTILRATCGDGAGGEIQTAIDVDGCVGNLGGILSC